ncbi:MAG: hypothetical protein U1E17_05175 [Geminicoccaceae bacterium]
MAARPRAGGSSRSGQSATATSRSRTPPICAHARRPLGRHPGRDRLGPGRGSACPPASSRRTANQQPVRADARRGRPGRDADRFQLAKYVVHQVAASTARPRLHAKPMVDEPGSGLHLQTSLWQDGKPIFAGQGYAISSQLCLQFVAGVMQHARALNAFTNPTTNSYKRLAPGRTSRRCCTAHNRSAAVRISYCASAAAKRIEGFRFPTVQRQSLPRLRRS